jgi:hypothetical protein
MFTIKAARKGNKALFYLHSKAEALMWVYALQMLGYALVVRHN